MVFSRVNLGQLSFSLSVDPTIIYLNCLIDCLVYEMLENSGKCPSHVPSIIDDRLLVLSDQQSKIKKYSSNISNIKLNLMLIYVLFKSWPSVDRLIVSVLV